MSKKTLPEIIEENKRILRAEYERGYIAGIKETKKRYIKDIITDLNDCLRLEDNGFGNKTSCDCESNVIEKIEEWLKKE